MRGKHKPHVFGVCNGCGRRRSLRYTGAVSSHLARSKDGTLTLGYPCPGVDHMPYRLVISDEPALRRNRVDSEWKMKHMRKPVPPARVERPIVPVAKVPAQPAMPPSGPPRPVVFRLDPDTVAALAEAMVRMQAAAQALTKTYLDALAASVDQLAENTRRMAEALDEANENATLRYATRNKRPPWLTPVLRGGGIVTPDSQSERTIHGRPEPGTGADQRQVHRRGDQTQ